MVNEINYKKKMSGMKSMVTRGAQMSVCLLSWRIEGTEGRGQESTRCMREFGAIISSFGLCIFSQAQIDNEMCRPVFLIPSGNAGEGSGGRCVHVELYEGQCSRA